MAAKYIKVYTFDASGGRDGGRPAVSRRVWISLVPASAYAVLVINVSSETVRGIRGPAHVTGKKRMGPLFPPFLSWAKSPQARDLERSLERVQNRGTESAQTATPQGNFFCFQWLRLLEDSLSSGS